MAFEIVDILQAIYVCILNYAYFELESSKHKTTKSKTVGNFKNICPWL